MKTSCFFAALAAIGLGMLTGCSSKLSPEPFDPNMRLTAGQVKMNVKVGETSREEIFRALGSPNTVAMETGAGEVWTYDQIKVRQTTQGYGTGAFFATIFGFPDLPTKDSINNGAGETGVEATANMGTNTTTVHTATLVVKFSKEGKVASYKMLITMF